MKKAESNAMILNGRGGGWEQITSPEKFKND